MMCGKKIEIPGTNGTAVTYCMLELGHKGDCPIANVIAAQYPKAKGISEQF